MQTITLKDTEKEPVTASITDALGQPAPGGGVTWQTSDPNVAVVDASANLPLQLNGFVVAKGVGTCIITATGGPANAPFTSQFQVNVTPGAPAAFTFVFGAPVPQ